MGSERKFPTSKLRIFFKATVNHAVWEAEDSFDF